MKKLLLLLLTNLLLKPLFAQQPLTVDKIMADPKWIGVSPANLFWGEDSKTIYFSWNPEKTKGDSLYAATFTDKKPFKVSPQIRRQLPAANGVYNKARTLKIYLKNGDIFLLDTKTQTTRQITNTLEVENSAAFSGNEQKILFVKANNLFSFSINSGEINQLTNFLTGTKKPDAKLSEQEKWLKQDQLAYFKVLKERADKKKEADKINKADLPRRPKEVYLDEKNVDNIQLSPDENFITYRLLKPASGAKSTIVPNYVTESGFTEELPARTKVGASLSSSELFVYNIKKDTVYPIVTKDIPGISDKTDFSKDYPAKKDTSKTKKEASRKVFVNGPVWSEDGLNAVVVVRSEDNKDRWIMLLDVQTGKLKQLDRQRDEAWIAGPGIGGWFSAGNLGWVDNQTIWFQSEADGYSHIYTVNVKTGEHKQLTKGKFEVKDAELSKDKKFFYFTSNEVHPGEQHYYKMSVLGGERVKLTSMTGANLVALSPDETKLAYLYSYANKPWELFVQDNTVSARPIQVTQSLSAEFKSYAWIDPKVITFKASDGAEVYARVYEGKGEKGKKPAVIFVHGAGYLQNAHKWWSQYFREYMFHNLLVEKGYTVLDIDYRASAGYGRDCRTGIYRFMGGKDLSDQVDGVKYLVENQGVDPKRIGIYGGSYGGFITLMGLLTTPDVFAAGAALRPVTDWAAYNHGYTSNILNEPFTDSLAYARSSPLYHAEGLKNPLLICHGMVDVNVHFQDVVRLSQRLIELKKENWELAVYPMEDHGFVEPSSWTDEYKRILKLFETNLKK